MKKAVFLDRDGTINIEKNYLYRIDDFEFLPGVIGGLKKLQDIGFLLIVITNQSGIARGYYTEEQYLILNEWMVQQLEKEGIKITESYYCPHHPDAKIREYGIDCECRKPKLGMYYEAIKKWNIDIDNSFCIGDKIRDCAICNTTSCKGILIGKNEEIDIINDVKSDKVKNVQYAESFSVAVNEIIKLMKL